MGSRASTTGFRWSRSTGNQPGVAAESKKVDTAEPRPLGSNITALARDLARMADLQMQLLSLDVQQFWAGARSGVFALCLAGIAVLGALPVLLLAFAGLLQRMLNLTPEIAGLIVGSVFVVGGTGTLWFSLRKIGKAARCLKRSQEELSENLTWVREALHQDDN